jgi:lipoprotein-anchoring transpeptidase ErfK/SrfK
MIKKTATSLSLIAAFGLASFVPSAVTPAAVSQTTPPTSSQIISTPESGKTTLVASNKNGKRGAAFNVYKTAGAGAKVQATLKNPQKSRLLFTVISESGDSYFVNLPTRPNGAKGFIKKADVTTYANPYRITISLTDRRLSAYKGDTLFMSTTVAIGKPDVPTPKGEFYTYWVRVPKAGTRGYGAYIIGLSAHSDKLTTFDGGDGRIGLHGTYDEALLGTPASSGCIRMSNKAITQLKETVWLGTPVIIY